MTSYKNFQSKSAKHTKNRFDIYEPAFESPVTLDHEYDIIKKHLPKWVAFCSFIRWMPDIYYDLITPSEGPRMYLDFDQRIAMRLLSRFKECAFCLPRGYGKTLNQVMVMYHTAICFPNITLAITSSTKESAVKIWKEKHEEILRFYPAIADEIKDARFSRDTGRVEFQNGAVIDSISNTQSSKGLRRRRGSLEESALINKDVYDDAILPIFNVPRKTVTGEIDPAELNGAISRFTTAGFRNSSEYEKFRDIIKEMVACNGQMLWGSDWMLPVYFKRQKKSTVDQARNNNPISFKQNYLCEWIGATDGALLKVDKLTALRSLSMPELECPKDKRGNIILDSEYVIAVDVARSDKESNNKTAIAIIKIIRNPKGSIRQLHLVNLIEPPNGLNFTEQSVIVKRTFYKYGGHSDLSKSRVKAVVVDSAGVGQGLIDALLREVTDPETNEELGCWATMNTSQKPETADSPEIVYSLKAHGINSDIITQFLNYVESKKLKMPMRFDDIKAALPEKYDQQSLMEIEAACLQIDLFINEVANLKLEHTPSGIKVKQLVRRIDKDRYSAIAYALYYIAMFSEKEDTGSDYDFQFFVN